MLTDKHTTDLVKEKNDKSNNTLLDEKKENNFLVFEKACLTSDLQKNEISINEISILDQEKTIELPETLNETPKKFIKKLKRNKYCQLKSFLQSGLDIFPVIVEVSISPGITKFDIIGLSDISLKHSKERVSKALSEAGYNLPLGNITVNLAPTQMLKKGSLYDLPIALALLIASGQITPVKNLDDFIICGELSLDAKIRFGEGVFAKILHSIQTEEEKRLLIPKSNLPQIVPLTRQIKNSKIKEIASFGTLKGCIKYFLDNTSRPLDTFVKKLANENFEQQEEFAHIYLDAKRVIDIPPTNNNELEKRENSRDDLNLKSKKNSTPQNLHETKHNSSEKLDFNQVIGQELGKLALELSVINRLNVLFVGPPGCGKTMLLNRLPSILPELSEKDALMLTQIRHVSNQNQSTFNGPTSFSKNTPFRVIHPSIPITSLIGGGRFPKPGEISLAHKGYLFLDEISLFPKNTLQCLRTPVEEKSITLSRLDRNITYPADFVMMASCNPCSCGYRGDPDKPCHCSSRENQRFFSKLTMPFLDRFDIILQVSKVKSEHFDMAERRSSSEIVDSIKKAQERKSLRKSLFEGRNLSEIFDENKQIKEIVLQAVDSEIISLRRVLSMLKILDALILKSGESYDKIMILKALELARNPLINLQNH